MYPQDDKPHPVAIVSRRQYQILAERKAAYEASIAERANPIPATDPQQVDDALEGGR